MEKKIIAIIAALLLLVAVGAGWWFLSKKPTATTAPAAPVPTGLVCPYDGTIYTNDASGAKYCFYPKFDSSKGDIRRETTGFPASLAACESDPTCLGLNSSGYLKKIIKPHAQWAYYPTKLTKNEGLYVRESTVGSY